VTTSPESKPFKTVKKRIVKSKKSGAAEANSRDGVDSATSSDTQNAIAAKKADDDLSVEFCATDSVASESFGADIRTASNQPGGARTTRSKEAVAGKNGGSDSEACDESCLTPLRSLSSDHLRLESQPAEKAERAENDSASDSVDEKPEVEVGAEVGADAGADAGDSPRRLKLHSASRADMQKEADRAMDVSKRVLNAIGFRPASTVRSAPSRSN
jgi:hypothetical protein